MNIDRDLLREHAQACRTDPYGIVMSGEELDAILDALDQAEAERDRWHSMWRQRGIKHLDAEKRATRAEARADIRGRAVAIYQQRESEAEAAARRAHDRAYKADLAWKDEKRRADKAEQRLAAWMDEYRRATHTGAVNEMMAILEHDDHTLRYGSPTTPCGQGPCRLGDGHEGNCRM